MKNLRPGPSHTYTITAALLLVLIAAPAPAQDFKGTITLCSGQTLSGTIKLAEFGVVLGSGVGTLREDYGSLRLKVGEEIVVIPAAGIWAIDANWVDEEAGGKSRWTIKQIVVTKRDGSTVVGEPSWLLHCSTANVQLDTGETKRAHAFPLAQKRFSPGNFIRRIVIGPEEPPDQGLTADWTNLVKPIVEWIADLKSPDPAVRRQAAWVLSGLQLSPDETLEPLRHTLHDEVGEVRAMAARALGAIGAPAADTMSELIDLLTDEHAPAREEATTALGTIAPQAATPTDAATREVVGALAEALRDDDSDVRTAAAAALGKFGAPGLDALLGGFSSADDDLRVKLISTLGQTAKDSPEPLPTLVPPLLDALNDRSEKVRVAAVSALGKVAKRSPEATPGLLLALEDGSAKVRQEAVRRLGALGSAVAEDVVPALVQVLRQADAEIVGPCVWAISRMGPEGTKALAAELASQDETLRVRLVSALKLVGHPAPKDLSDALLAALRDPSSEVRVAAATTLGHWVHALSKRTGHKVKVPQFDGAVPPLAAALLDDEVSVRVAAAQALGKLGVCAQAAIPSLQESITDEDRSVQTAAAAALSSIYGELAKVLAAQPAK